MRSKSEFKQEEKFELLALFRKEFDDTDGINKIYKSYQLTNRQREYLHHMVKQQIQRIERRRIGRI